MSPQGFVMRIADLVRVVDWPCFATGPPSRLRASHQPTHDPPPKQRQPPAHQPTTSNFPSESGIHHHPSPSPLWPKLTRTPEPSSHQPTPEFPIPLAQGQQPVLRHQPTRPIANCARDRRGLAEAPTVHSGGDRVSAHPRGGPGPRRPGLSKVGGCRMELIRIGASFGPTRRVGKRER